MRHVRLVAQHSTHVHTHRLLGSSRPLSPPTCASLLTPGSCRTALAKLNCLTFSQITQRAAAPSSDSPEAARLLSSPAGRRLHRSQLLPPVSLCYFPQFKITLSLGVKMFSSSSCPSSSFSSSSYSPCQLANCCRLYSHCLRFCHSIYFSPD